MPAEARIRKINLFPYYPLHVWWSCFPAHLCSIIDIQHFYHPGERELVRTVGFHDFGERARCYKYILRKMACGDWERECLPGNNLILISVAH